MENFIIFGILSVPVIFYSWRNLFNFRSHGFYRFFSFECILWLLVSNYKVWFENPLSGRQVFSWILLFLSAYLVIAAVILLKKARNPAKIREDDALYPFEKTSELIETGIYKYIRHPMYSSLIFLTWGIFLKDPAGPLLVVALLSSGFLYLTALFDEKECMAYFGDNYRQYRKRSKMFIPFLF